MSRLWRRYGELNIGGRVLKCPPMHIEFEENFSTAVKSTAKIKIYNPSDDTVETAKKKGCLVIMAAGYEEDFGTCFTGEVFKLEYKAGTTSELDIEVSDKSELWAGTVVNRNWRGPIAASEVIRDLLETYGMTGRIELGTDFNYERGISFAGSSLSASLRKMASDTKSELFFRSGSAAFIAPKKGYTQGYALSPSSGLLSVEETGTGYKIKTLFLHHLGAGNIAKLSLPQGDVTIKIIKGVRRFSVYGDAGVEFEAVRL